MRWLLALCGAMAMAQNPPTMFPPVRGTRGMVGAANNYEVEAGWRMLEHGGNAVDAGVAAVLAASVTELSRFGIGGEMPAIVKMAAGEPVVIAGVGRAPKLATVEYFRKRGPEAWEEAGHMPPIPENGIHAAITPGAFDALMVALEKFGTKPFAEVVQPAIELAESGFAMPEEFGHMLVGYEKILSLWPVSQRFFYPEGAATPVGALFREPAYAATLRELGAAEKKARGGRVKKIEAVRNAFYRGISRPRGTAGDGNVSRIHDREAGVLDAGAGDDRDAEYFRGLRSEGDGA